MQFNERREKTSRTGTLEIAVMRTIPATRELCMRRSSDVAAIKQKFHVPFTLGT
jgi:hypothetical protein